MQVFDEKSKSELVHVETVKQHLRHIVSAWPDGDFTFEVRTIGGTTAGRFFNRHDIDEAAKAIEARYKAHDDIKGVFVTFNPTTKPPSKDWLSQGLTKDTDIARRCWLVVDIDPKRPADSNSTNEEQGLADAVRGRVEYGLANKGWGDPTVAMSGNGWHLWYAIDLPNTDEAKNTVKRVLQELGEQYNTEKVKIDTSLSNAARIIKLVGTLARKQAHTQDRPQRQAYFNGALRPVNKVPEDLLQGFAVDTLSRPPVVATHTPTIPPKSQVEAYLQGICHNLATAQPGERNKTLFLAALNASSMVAAGWVDEAQAWREITAAGHATGLELAEVNKTASNGWEHGKNNPPPKLNQPHTQSRNDKTQSANAITTAPSVAAFEGARQELVVLHAYLQDINTATHARVARLASRQWVNAKLASIVFEFEPGAAPSAAHLEAKGVAADIADKLAGVLDVAAVPSCIECLQRIDKQRREDDTRKRVADCLQAHDIGKVRAVLDEHDDNEARHVGVAVVGREAMRAHFEKIKARHELGRALGGLATGIHAVDTLTNGLDKLIMFGGASGIGKTNLLLAMARGVLANEAQTAVVYLSFEQTPFTLHKRCLCALAHLTSKQCGQGVPQSVAGQLSDKGFALSDKQTARLVKAQNTLEGWADRFDLVSGNDLPDANRATVVGYVRNAARRFGVSTDKVCVFFDSFTSAMPRMIENTKANAKEIQDAAIDELGRIQHDLGGPLVSIAELNKANMTAAHPGIDAFTGSGHIVHRVDMAGSLVRGAWLRNATAHIDESNADTVDFGDDNARNREEHNTPMRLVFVKARDEGIANRARWLVHNWRTQSVRDAGEDESNTYEGLHNEACDKATRANKPPKKQDRDEII